MVDVVKLRVELEEDEGRVDAIYLDHLGKPTFGIGHLVNKKDPEHMYKVGTAVPPERVFEAFEDDIKIVIKEIEGIFPGYYEKPDEVQLILANMLFNLGGPRLKKFKKLREAVAAENWQEAAAQMLDPKWAEQVPNRANRLIERMKAVG